MKLKYKVLQHKKINNYTFMGYEWAKNHGFTLKDYEMVYDGEIEEGKTIESTLEEIFIELNCHHPANYKGHSLSTSDIVVIKGKKYYCDSIGWEIVK